MIFNVTKDKDYIEFSGVLTAGGTRVTFSDSSITANSTVDTYTSVYGVNPINVVAQNGSVVLDFEAQDNDIDVKVRIS